MISILENVFKGKVKTQEQIIQENIINNKMICPLCGNDKFINNGLVAPSHGGGGKIIYKTHNPIEEHDITSIYCNKCGYIILFKRF